MFEEQKKATIKIKNIWSEVSGLKKEPLLALYEELSYELLNAHWIRLAKPYWDAKKRLFKKSNREKDCGYFLTGLLSRVIETLYKNFQIKPIIIDLRSKPSKTLNLEWNDEKYTLRDYQKETIKSCVEKGRGVIEAATGSGKTLIAAKIIQEIGVPPFIFYVLTKDLLYQAKEKLEDSIKNLRVGVIGNGECDIQDVNVMTIQTACRAYNEPIDSELKKYDDLDEDDINMIKSEDFSHLKTKREDIKKLIENTQGVYFDEVQHCPATTCQKTIEKSTNAYYLFGGSATPYRADNATIVIEGLFGRKRAEIDASRLIKEGYLESPQIFYIKLKEPNKRVNNYEEDYKSHIVNNEERNNHIIKICEQLKEKKIPTMILVQRIEHGEFLQSKINGSRFIQGSSSKKTRQKALYDLDNGLLPVLLATSLADEGLDLPCLSALVIASGGKSITKVKQRVGRVIRKHPNKKCALVFDFLDVGRWVSKHARKRRQILKSEKQFRIYETDNFILTEKTIKKELF